MRPDWFVDWTGEVCAIVAGGESIEAKECSPGRWRSDVVEMLRGRCRVAVVNNSYQLAPWGDVLYAADRRWWECNPEAASFKGLKVTPDKDAAKQHRLNLIRLIEDRGPSRDELTIAEPGLVARGGNSVFQLTNIVLQFGVRRILWLGVDCRGKHWHGDHPMPLRNPTPQRLAIWAATFDAQAKRLRQMGAEIVNCSEVSALQAYKRMSVEAALSRCGI